MSTAIKNAVQVRRHDRSSSSVGYLALSIFGNCGGSLLAPEFLGWFRYTLGKRFLIGVVAPRCRSWSAYRRLNALRLVRETIRADWSGNAGSLGPDAQASCRWAVSICPQSNDNRRFTMLLGLALIWGSWVVGVWALLFFLVNHTYFILSEEPGLERRFGDSFRTYKANVPRWIPRSKPWEG
jgi:hypothetical protein